MSLRPDKIDHMEGQGPALIFLRNLSEPDKAGAVEDSLKPRFDAAGAQGAPAAKGLEQAKEAGKCQKQTQPR